MRTMEYYIKKIDTKMTELKIINAEESEVYYFGLYEGILLLFNFFITLFLAMIFSTIKIGALFLIAYAPIRCYSGGYHFKTRTRCLCGSILLIIVALKGIEVVSLYLNSLLILEVALWFNFAIIWRLAPVENPKNPLSLKEKHDYKGIVATVIFIENVIATFMFAYIKIISCIVLVAEWTSFLLLGIEVLRLQYSKRGSDFRIKSRKL